MVDLLIDYLRPRLRQGYAEAYGCGERILRGGVC